MIAEGDNVQMCKCVNVQMGEWANGQMDKC